jgi:hypothetical protein
MLAQSHAGFSALRALVWQLAHRGRPLPLAVRTARSRLRPRVGVGHFGEAARSQEAWAVPPGAECRPSTGIGLERIRNSRRLGSPRNSTSRRDTCTSCFLNRASPSRRSSCRSAWTTCVRIYARAPRETNRSRCCLSDGASTIRARCTEHSRRSSGVRLGRYFDVSYVGRLPSLTQSVDLRERASGKL